MLRVREVDATEEAPYVDEGTVANAAEGLTESVAARVDDKATDDVRDEGRLKALFNTVSSYGVRPVHPGTSVTLYAEPRRMSRDGPILLTGTA